MPSRRPSSLTRLRCPSPNPSRLHPPFQVTKCSQPFPHYSSISITYLCSCGRFQHLHTRPCRTEPGELTPVEGGREGEPKPGSPLKSSFPSPEETCTSLRQLQPVLMQEDHLSPGQLVLLHSHPVQPFGASHHEQLVYIATMKLNCGRLSSCNEVISRWQHEEGIKNLVSCSGLRLQGDRSWCAQGT